MAHLGVAFDLDDTLIESFPTYVALHQRVAADLGWPVPSERDLVAYDGGWRPTLRRLFPGRPIERFVARYDALADRHPYPAIAGALAVIDRLERLGVPMWIVTSRSRRRLGLRMAQAGLAPSRFAGIFCREDLPAPKPSPRCFEPVAAHPAAAGRRLVYVGDRWDDRAAARGAGVPFVGVATGPEARTDLGPPPGALSLASVADLLPYLDDVDALDAALAGGAT